MNTENEKNKSQPSEKIDEVIEKAIENAEVRKELSEEELDGVAGGTVAGGSIRTLDF